MENYKAHLKNQWSYNLSHISLGNFFIILISYPKPVTVFMIFALSYFLLSWKIVFSYRSCFYRLLNKYSSLSIQMWYFYYCLQDQYYSRISPYFWILHIVRWEEWMTKSRYFYCVIPVIIITRSDSLFIVSLVTKCK